jgi:multidrug efflux pump
MSKAETGEEAQKREQRLRSSHNTARFFVENRAIAWVLLVGVIAWGFYGYAQMPKRKDPAIPVRVASAVTPWPGASVAQIEELVTRAVENTAAQNSHVHPASPTSFGIKSLTLPGVSIVQIQLDESVSDPEKEFSDINLRLNALNPNLPQGAGPIQFNSGFGDTAALLLTVASPKEGEVELALRARDLARDITAARASAGGGAGQRATLVVALPRSVNSVLTARGVTLFADFLAQRPVAADPRFLQGPGYVGVDLSTEADDATLLATLDEFMHARLGLYRFQADAWDPIVIRDPAEAQQRLTAAAGDKYSYRELDDFTDLITRTLEASVPQVSNITRSGVLQEQVFLAYSQERLAAYGIQPTVIKKLLTARNTLVPGGALQADDLNLQVQPSGDFTGEDQIGGVIIARSGNVPVYLRDIADIYRGYQSPPLSLNFHTWRDAGGKLQRSRAINIAVNLRSGQQIGDFGAEVDRALKGLETRLPADLVISRTSDQPLQVAENIDLFMTALYEAVILVVLVAFLGFREWRAATLMMLAIPITLAMTFGMLFTLGIDLQQVSVATLIIALGLLVDDPVVAGDAIKRELNAGEPPILAAWLGPVRLAEAILFATITNVVAYLPLLLLTGNQGDFLHSLPIVMACALIASRIVSMTFIPLLAYYLLRPDRKPEPPIEQRRREGFSGRYYRRVNRAIDLRWWVLVASLFILASGVYFKHQLKDSFFPDDVQYLSYVDLWMRNDLSAPGTNLAAQQAEQIIREAAEAYGKDHPGKDGKPREILESVSTFVGGGAPRFWFAVTPELQQQNYAQLIVRVRDKEDTPVLAGFLQTALSERLPGAIADVRQLQTNPVPYPVEIRISGRAAVTDAERGEDIRTLRALAAEVRDILQTAPMAARVRDDWANEIFALSLDIDPDRANLAGVTNQDVAASSAAGLNGTQVAILREGRKQIPVLARLRPSERAQISDLQNLYVFATEDKNKIPLGAVASINYRMETQRVRRAEHFRTVSVIGFPRPGALPSEVMGAVKDQLAALRERMPPGYALEIAGEQAKSEEGFGQLITVMRISVAMIFLALVFQFRSAVKPWLVFAAVPYGVVAALAGLYVMGSSFGFMGFLGIVSLIGVIVSHVIVLFDFIEERHRLGEPFREAVLDAGIIRLRPVLITVGATVLALFPLAIHGGPLWQPLCYAQIGGLAFATVITKVLVPVIYAICVLDLKIVRWEEARTSGSTAALRSSADSRPSA